MQYNNKLLVLIYAVLSLGYVHAAFADSITTSNNTQAQANYIQFDFLSRSVTKINDKQNSITPSYKECGGLCDDTIGFGDIVSDPNKGDIMHFTVNADPVPSSDVKNFVINIQKKKQKSPYKNFTPKKLNFAYMFDLNFNFSRTGDLTCPGLILAQGQNDQGNNTYLFSNFENSVAVKNGDDYYQTDIACYTSDNEKKIFNVVPSKDLDTLLITYDTNASENYFGNK